MWTLPRTAHELARRVVRGQFDDRLDELEADDRVTVRRAVARRRKRLAEPQPRLEEGARVRHRNAHGRGHVWVVSLGPWPDHGWNHIVRLVRDDGRQTILYAKRDFLEDYVGVSS